MYYNNVSPWASRGLKVQNFATVQQSVLTKKEVSVKLLVLAGSSSMACIHVRVGVTQVNGFMTPMEVVYM